MSDAAVRWSERARKDLQRLDPANQRRVASVVARFAETREGDVKRLQGPLGSEFRLRSGDLRVRFFIDGDGTIVVLRVLPRDKAYR
jgi:mRNA-degrading endonuclease RelE of RelBE toxin-antitoxin system